MIKKHLFIILIVIIFILFALLISVYKYNKDLVSNYEMEQVKIYEENNLKLKALEEDYGKNIKVLEEKNKKLEEEKMIPKSTVASVPIFMYHFIRDDVGNYEYPENMVKINTLKEQLIYIMEKNYEPIYITDFSKLYKYTKPVALTFDDGWEDFYTNAFPLIKEYKIKVTLFVVDKFFTVPGYCNIDQLREIKESGLVDIQSHTMTHPHLTKIKASDLQYEIENSKTILKEKLNINSTVLCYPYGDYNTNVVQKTKQYYNYGLRMEGGVYHTDKYDKYKIPRIYANRSMTLNTFISYLNKSNVKVEW